MAGENQKLKLLYLMQMFMEDTDQDHGLTMPQIIQRLEELGVEAERKAVYRDIKALQEFGLDIQKYQRQPVEYGLASREFSRTELLLMIDAVQSSRFLTKRKSDALVRSIKGLGPKSVFKGLDKRVHVEGRIRNLNESVFYNVDTIQDALTAKRKVEFRYFKYDANKKRVLQHDGGVYVETPVHLAYVDDYYYLIVYNDKYDRFANYRVDRMLDIKVSDQKATKNQQIATFDVGEYVARSVGMFTGDLVTVRLVIDESLVSSVIDRFGKDVLFAPAGEGKVSVSVRAMNSPTLYGWLAQFGTGVRVEGPAAVKEGYRYHLMSIVEAHAEED